MSFFIRGKTNKPNIKINGERKRKFAGVKKGTQPLERKPRLDEELDSEDEDVIPGPDIEPEDDSRETTQEKRLRLAKLYLSEIEQQESERLESDTVDRAAVAQRLKESVLEQSGRLRRTVADNYSGADTPNIAVLRCKQHKLAITCMALSPDDKFLYSGSKDCNIVQWCLTKRQKERCILAVGKRKTPGHNKSILCLAVSSDSRFLVSGGEELLVHVWKADTLDHLHCFKGHKGPVTGLCFQRGSHTLFSSSRDRSVKIWNLDEMSYIETLLGHQSEVTSVDALQRERAVTSGGRDCSVRVWKVVEESQLIFNGHKGSIDAVKLVNEDHFLSCGDDGQLCLWGSMKKKPLCVVPDAHGLSQDNGEPNWVCSIAAFVNTDLVASGSSDGHIRLWKCGNGFKTLSPLFQVTVAGFVNALSFTSDGGHLVAGVGQEHRLGRWCRRPDAKNSILIIPLMKT